MTKDSTVTISEELLDAMVNALTHLPYRQVQGLFLQLGADLEKYSEPQQTIVTGARK